MCDLIIRFQEYTKLMQFTESILITKALSTILTIKKEESSLTSR